MRSHEVDRRAASLAGESSTLVRFVEHSLSPAQRSRLKVVAATPNQSLMVHEIYASIQGESTFAGLPCTFVRLTGCHLRCRWCDTPHAFSEGKAMTRAEIVAEVRRLAPSLVEITGGEPLAQPGALPLMTELSDAGLNVLLETAGALPVHEVDPRVTIILDVKCPGSGEVEANFWPNLDVLKPSDELKFVISDRADFDWSVELVKARGLLKNPVLFAPVFGELPLATLAQWIIDAGLPIRFQLQQHKFIWSPEARGV